MKRIRKIACWGAHRSGLSLIELMVVILILAALAGIVLPLTSGVSEEAQLTTTRSTLRTVQGAINRYILDTGMLPQPSTTEAFDAGNQNSEEGRVSHPMLLYLYQRPQDMAEYDPVLRRGWNGPYLVDSPGEYLQDNPNQFWQRFGFTDDPTPIDAWGRPIVIVADDGTDWNPDLGQPVRWFLKSAGPDGFLEDETEAGDDISLEVFYQAEYQVLPEP